MNNAQAPAYPTESLDVINELRAVQGVMTDAEFCRRYLRMSDARWNQIHNIDKATGLPVYASKVKDFSAVLEDLAEDLIRIRSLKSFERDTGDRTFFLFDPFARLLNAVKTASASDGHRRFIMVLADTGGGKTTFIRHLMTELKAEPTHARESWRRSYKAALIDIMDDLAITPREFRVHHCLNGTVRKRNVWRRTEPELERALIAGLNKKRRIVCIDEGHVFGPRSINLFKLILNESPTVLVVASLPEFYERWQAEAWDDARQILRRSLLVEECGTVLPEEAERFLTGLPLNGERGAAAAALAEAANQFGRYDFVAEAAIWLRSRPSTDMETVTLAIDRTSRMFGRATGNQRRPSRLPAARARKLLKGTRP